jgi:phosphoadenosine phosphosulfate reductase
MHTNIKNITPELNDRVVAVEAMLDQIQSQYQPAVLASSLSIEDMVLTDLILRCSINIGIFTLDTGRLHLDTLDVISRIEDRYKIRIEVIKPSHVEVNEYVTSSGLNGFYKSIELRQRCCEIRKVIPLRAALKDKKAWLTGQRRDQSATRQLLAPKSFDNVFGLEKFNPLFDWSEQQVWDYIRHFDVPFNKLYEQGYQSIGCAPCSRPIVEGEAIRAGRWWWEAPETKECGLHIDVNGKVQKRE